MLALQQNLDLMILEAGNHEKVTCLGLFFGAGLPPVRK